MRGSRSTCIYCPADPSTARQDAHVFPQAVVQNEFVLPRGVMCDDCNQYLGRQLDQMLARHPGIAWAVQSMALPGKRGKPRQMVANILRKPPEAVFQVEIGPFEVQERPDGTKVLLIKPMLDPEFDLLRFRRALHMVAFNTVAYRDGASALDPQYSPVREYIRRPGIKQAWPFATTYRTGTTKDEVCIDLYQPGEYGFIAKVRVFNHDFYVDLLNTGRLEEWAKAEKLASVEFVGPDATYPASPRDDAVPSGKRYRLRVVDE